METNLHSTSGTSGNSGTLSTRDNIDSAPVIKEVALLKEEKRKRTEEYDCFNEEQTLMPEVKREGNLGTEGLV
jgi:hypothetical protein